MGELDLKKIIDRLNAELTCDARKLAFWYDDKAEFEEDIDSVELTDWFIVCAGFGDFLPLRKRSCAFPMAKCLKKLCFHENNLSTCFSTSHPLY